MTEQKNTSISAGNAFNTLKKMGYSQGFIQKLLPEWWDNNLLKTSAGSFQFAMVLRQKLGIGVSFSDSGELLIHNQIDGVLFKHTKNTLPEQLVIAANLGYALGLLASLCIKKYANSLIRDPITLRNTIMRDFNKKNVDFESLLKYCWSIGIPVLFLNDLPKKVKKMMGMAAFCHGRPTIILGFKNNQASRQLFVLAHELGHIACGHVVPGHIMVDESIHDVIDSISDRSLSKKDKEEKEADEFALKLIRGNVIDPVANLDPKFNATSLAAYAILESDKLKIDAGHLILSYAKLYDDWSKANLAMNFIPNQSGALDVLKQQFLNNAILTHLSEDNEKYLISAQGFM